MTLHCNDVFVIECMQQNQFWVIDHGRYKKLSITKCFVIILLRAVSWLVRLHFRQIGSGGLEYLNFDVSTIESRELTQFA